MTSFNHICELSSIVRPLILLRFVGKSNWTTIRKASVSPSPAYEDNCEENSSWQIHSYGGLEQLQLTKSPRYPSLQKPNNILVKVNASSVNPIDIAMVGGYGSVLLNAFRQLETCSTSILEFPLTLGRDFVGEVVEKGHGVGKELRTGDHVWGVVPAHQQGAHATHILTSSSYVQKKPHNLTDAESASIPYAAVTAWSALKITGGLCIQPARGKRVLVLGGSGGVGTMAVQMLKAWGAEVIATCSTDAVPLLQALGVDTVIDYTHCDVENNIRSEGKYDIILNAAGKIKIEYLDTLKDWSLSKYITLTSPLLRNTNEYGLFGGMLRNTCDLLQQNLQGLSKGSVIQWAFFIPSSTALKEITALVENGKIRPTVQHTYPFSEVPEAYKRVAAGHARGKTVICMNDSHST